MDCPVCQERLPVPTLDVDEETFKWKQCRHCKTNIKYFVRQGIAHHWWNVHTGYGTKAVGF